MCTDGSAVIWHIVFSRHVLFAWLLLPCDFFSQFLASIFKEPKPFQSPTSELLTSLSLSSFFSYWLWFLSLFTGKGITMDTSDTGLMEGGDDMAGVADESPSEVECTSAGEAELLEACDDEQMSPDSSEDMEDSGSLVSEQFLTPGSKAGGLGLFLRPAWYLAIFEEQCFSPEVSEYAVSLGQHTGTPCLDVKRQVSEPVRASAMDSQLTFTLCLNKQQKSLNYLSDPGTDTALNVFYES